MHPNLSFEQAPPISVPLRFFLTAPWFGVAGGLLLAVLGGDALASRWTPGVLAVTHLIVAGFMLQAMCGALLQFVPVAAGGNVWRPRLVAGLVHPLLILATLFLVAAFLTARGALFAAAAHLFGITLGAYVLIVGWALLRTPAQGPTLLALRLAVLGLAVTLTLGIALATGLGGDRGWPLIQITNVHAGWGLGGWALMLLMGVSYFVVPMFQLTPSYPNRVAWGLPAALFALLCVWSIQLSGDEPVWLKAVWLLGVAIAAGYATTTLWLQLRRRRRIGDPTLLFFRIAMACLLTLLATALLTVAWPDLAQEPRIAVWIGMLAIPGVFVSAISGMLYKIAPFLNWLHLQRLGGITQPPPNMRDMISESAIYGHLKLHGVALASLLISVPFPDLTRGAGILFAASCAWLGWNLIAAVRVYLAARDRILAAGADPVS